jgi:hypothetical protein
VLEEERAAKVAQALRGGLTGYEKRGESAYVLVLLLAMLSGSSEERSNGCCAESRGAAYGLASRRSAVFQRSFGRGVSSGAGGEGRSGGRLLRRAR